MEERRQEILGDLYIDSVKEAKGYLKDKDATNREIALYNVLSYMHQKFIKDASPEKLAKIIKNKAAAMEMKHSPVFAITYSKADEEDIENAVCLIPFKFFKSSYIPKALDRGEENVTIPSKEIDMVKLVEWYSSL